MIQHLIEQIVEKAPQLTATMHGTSVIFEKEGVSYEVQQNCMVCASRENTTEAVKLKNIGSVIAYILKFEDPVLMHNSVVCLSCEDVIVSRHRHDYVTCKCGAVSIDGGCDYTRTTVRDLAMYYNLSVSSDSSHFAIREVLERGSRGEDGTKPLTWVKLKDISDEYLVKLIAYCEEHEQYTSVHYFSYLAEVAYRK